MNEFKIMKILREAKNYSQDYISQKLGINQNTYSKLENGQMKLTTERIRKLAELYNVNPDIFLSKDLPVINYNIGDNSHSGIIETYNNHTADYQLIEKILNKKNNIIQDKEI
ncbi:MULTISPECIES: helix-turn-helix domain-containing protein [unclassified Sphingobacterium]|uniref:helix-turn-helix domain-containing protein n=1 Tax=unclassified Sphingobacterium TaxID=2609468 RepID=UPI00104BD235|nr:MULTISPECIES: helix-turn-helix transcriptional regulator [unclassified Sphingobacterium]MCS3553061.1 transcriptional regulator with XRE-family HTH domain [Sphingobacterium sp. JUb21]TCR09729.1 transcriptional regulator with XRE-family HTH domain [Sphingobacterium sp. JUb20]